MNSVHHSNRLPARLALPGLVMSGGKIVKDPHRSLEADAVLLPVGPVSFVLPR
jgi:hypothetical protein